MPSLISEFRSRRQLEPAPERSIITVDDYAMAINDMVLAGAQPWGLGPTAAQWQHEPAERVVQSFEGYARQLYESNGLVYSVMGVRILAFSLVRFAWQAMRNGRPTKKLFGTQALAPLETPWPGGTTQELLMRMIQDADIAGNAYVTKVGPDLVRLRPDWVNIILAPIITDYGGVLGYRRVGYTYHDGGIEQCPIERVGIFAPSEVAHFAPRPAPDARYRGESWLTPVIREVTNDKMMERHKTKFFENAATPNISVALSDSVTPQAFAEFKEKMQVEHRGVDNAYKTLFLGGGADVKVIGANLAQIDFQSIQGRGETRVAAAAGVPPIIVGLSEGLSSSTYSNYEQAMRRFGELTMAGLWGNAAGSLATLIASPGSDARLWYDTRDVAFLQANEKARTEVQQMRAATIQVYITSGFTPESAVAAAEAEDTTLLEHSGLVSVQLQPPGTDPAAAGAAPSATPKPAAKPADKPAAPAAAATPAAPAAPGRALAVPDYAYTRSPEAPAEHTGQLDEVDRALLANNAHPHPRLLERE